MLIYRLYCRWLSFACSVVLSFPKSCFGISYALLIVILLLLLLLQRSFNPWDLQRYFFVKGEALQWVALCNQRSLRLGHHFMVFLCFRNTFNSCLIFRIESSFFEFSIIFFLRFSSYLLLYSSWFISIFSKIDF